MYRIVPVIDLGGNSIDWIHAPLGQKPQSPINSLVSESNARFMYSIRMVLSERQYGKITDSEALKYYAGSSDFASTVAFYKVGRVCILAISDIKNIASGDNLISNIPQ